MLLVCPTPIKFAGNYINLYSQQNLLGILKSIVSEVTFIRPKESYMGFAGLELFQARQYLDPHLMSTGKRSSRKRQRQRGLMQAQVKQYTDLRMFDCIIEEFCLGMRVIL